MPKEINHDQGNQDIVVSSRVRMARNMKKYFFPTLRDISSGEKVATEVYQSIVSQKNQGNEGFRVEKIKDLTEIQRLQMVEKHLISPLLANNYQTGAVVYNEKESLVIMINEEDHIRIQALLPGLQLEESFHNASRMDDIIEGAVDYAFDRKFGYLTACPTNVGTGLRASVMLHLPALSMSGEIQGMLQFANKIGLAVRGVYGEGSDFAGNLYQISNEVTLGVSEEEIIEKLKEVTIKIMAMEKKVREALFKEQPMEMEDQIYRSLGILKSARMITVEEAMKRLSNVQLGISLELIKGIEISEVHQWIAMIQPGSLQAEIGKELEHKSRDSRRATLLREKLINH